MNSSMIGSPTIISRRVQELALACLTGDLNLGAKSETPTSPPIKLLPLDYVVDYMYRFIIFGYA
jgi:hypothetical protein